MTVMVKVSREEEITRFLQLKGFEVDDLGEQVYRIRRETELPVFLKISDKNLFFEVDLGNIDSMPQEKEFYFRLLDMNTEILPVSFAIDSTNKKDPRLVLNESRETGDLCDDELLSVFDALEIAVDRAEALLSEFIKQGA